MNDQALIIGDQVATLVRENQNLRVKSDNDDKTIHLLGEQYKLLADQVRDIREKAASDVRRAKQDADDAVMDMQIERDQAKAAYQIIETNLLQAADLIMQAARAREGNATPLIMPKAQLPHIEDARLPAPKLQ